MNRRSFIKRMIASFLAFIGVTGGTYYYAREIEPTLLQVTETTLPSVKIPSGFNGFKIIQFSDTHIGYQYTIKQLKVLVKKINSLNPDLIVFTGDLIDDPNSFNDEKNLISSLKQLKSNYGKFWVYGNHDHGGYGTDSIRKIMDKSDFQLLKNNHILINKENDSIILAGIDDAILGKPNLGTTLLNANNDLFTMLLAHEPDYADITKDYPVDLQLSGHSHGGQVRLPLLGHLYTPALAEKYVQGEYTFNNDRLFLYVTNGIGTTRLPFRFLCKPELLVLTLNSTA